MDPLSISAIVVGVIAAVGSGIVAILQVLRGGFSCTGSECCVFDVENTDIHGNKQVNTG
jgi:hypothetical protein